MEIDYQALFSNRLIAPGEYLAKVIHAKAVDQNDGTKVLVVQILLGENDLEADGTALTAILHPTEKGQRFIDAFFESYRVGLDTLSLAVGRWAVVYVYQSEYKGSAFSVVKFHRQSAAAQAKVAELESPRPSMSSGFRVPRRQSLSFGYPGRLGSR